MTALHAASPRGNSLVKVTTLAWRQLRRDLKAGEIRILLAALVLAVLAVTAVGFVTDRAERALAIEANRLLGGDAVVRGDSPIAADINALADSLALQRTATVDLNTMVSVGSGSDARLQLGDLRALGAGFPLRGAFRIAAADGVERDAASVPAPGTAWLSRAGASALDAQPGDSIGIGGSRFTLVALVVAEPDAALDYFNIAPKVFINLDDLAATGLVQEGSRIGYRVVVAGATGAVDRFVTAVKPELARGQKLETAGDARPEIRAALDRAGRFLGLAALVSVVMAAVAVAMAARQHSQRHLSGTAVMRCLGASQATLAGIHIGELLMLGVLASAVGVGLAYALQWGIGLWLAPVLGMTIPHAGWLPALHGFAVGLVVLMAFGAPPVLALRRVPALRVLRRDLDPTEPSAWLVAAAGLAGLAALLWWKAGSAALGIAMLAGLVGTAAVLGVLGWGMIVLLRRLRPHLRGSLRYGLANVSRRPASSIGQIAALGLGLMALLLLTFVRTDLLDRWQLQLSADAPNRFIINVQDDQIDPVAAFIAAQGIAAPTLYPMIRARLVTHNGEPVVHAGTPDVDDAANAPDRRRTEREFNLSTATALGDDNRVVAGRFWSPERLPASAEISVESGYAKSLHWAIGDTVSFDVAGQPFQATVTSLREVDWTSFRPNFFVVASPGSLDGFPASHITAVSVPPDRPRFTAELVSHFPNMTVIDIDAVLAQVRATADQVSVVVEVVFWFSLATGLLVLLAAVSASQDERLLEGGVMRVLGGSRRQLRLAQASEFALVGLLSGIVAAVAASVLAGVVAVRVFDLPWQPNWAMAVAGALLGMLAALVAGMLATRKVLDSPPSQTLRESQG